jgi:hypothetical protein
MTGKQSRAGFAMIPNSLARCGKLTPKAMAVYLCLKSHAGTSNRTWLAHKTISKESNVSETAVKSALRELNSLGLVTWKKRIRPTDGRQTTNDYLLHDSDSILGRLFPPGPQASETYQVEEPIEEELLNSSSKGRARVRNIPSADKPASDKQIELLRSLFIELNSDLESNIKTEELDRMSCLAADEWINELKREKWKAEHFM